MVNDPGTGSQIPDQFQGLGDESAVQAAAPDANKRPSRRRVDLTQTESALVDKTRTQIRELVDEVHHLARQNCSIDEFYEGFLTRIVTALASVGGAIWTVDSENKAIDLQVHINLKQTSLNEDEEARKRHSMLIRRLCESGEPVLVPPLASNSSNQGGNPTEHLLVVGPLKIDGRLVGLVEIFQRAGAGPTTQRGYLRFVLQMCDIASEFLSNQRLRSYEQQEKMWHRLEQFVQSVHAGLDTQQTTYAIANESRRLAECDRVSVGLMHGRRCVIKAVSGLDSIERRSEQVKTLHRLATAVVKTGREMWFDGTSTSLAPQLEKRVHDHVDKSHARMIAVLPLLKSAGDSKEESMKKRKPVGALIIEQLSDAEISPELKARAEVIVGHSEVALTNCLDHQSIFLLPLWRFLGKITSQFHGQKLIRTCLIAGLLGGLVAFLCLFPYSFSLGAKGALVPELQHEVYAPLDGTLTSVNVSDTGDSLVQQGDLLAELSSPELELEINDLQGQLDQSLKERGFAETQKTRAKEPADKASYAFQYSRADQRITNLKQELKHKLAQREKLKVRAPLGGQVVNWQVRQNLLRRPVRFGQHLMTIVPPDTQWLLELEMPERRLTHLAEAMKEADEPLKVTFALLSWPGKEFEGELISMDQKLDVYSDEGNSSLVRVVFSNSDIPPELLRAGTRVTGKVQCGTRSIGYSMFYELIETVTSRWKFWF